MLYTEKVPNVNATEARIKKLKEEYKDNKGLSVHYFQFNIYYIGKVRKENKLGLTKSEKLGSFRLKCGSKLMANYLGFRPRICVFESRLSLQSVRFCSSESRAADLYICGYGVSGSVRPFQGRGEVSSTSTHSNYDWSLGNFRSPSAIRTKERI